MAMLSGKNKTKQNELRNERMPNSKLYHGIQMPSVVCLKQDQEREEGS